MLNYKKIQLNILNYLYINKININNLNKNIK